MMFSIVSFLRVAKPQDCWVGAKVHSKVSCFFSAGSYVALTLLGKPLNTGHQTSRDSTIGDSSIFIRNSITAPLPVDVSIFCFCISV